MSSTRGAGTAPAWAARLTARLSEVLHVDEYTLKREIRNALEEHQPRFDHDGPRRVCSCNSNVGGGRITDAYADHQSYEVVRRLRNRGLLR